METLEEQDSRFPGYRLECELGRGGFATVYRAVQTSLERPVALKSMEKSGSQVEAARFLREARCLAKLSHPAILPIYDTGQHAGEIYMACEYIAGGSLADLLERRGRLSVGQFLPVARSLSAGLAAAHARGILHRDLKPHNILMRGEDAPLICDFGLARVRGDHTLTRSGTCMGTLAYMAPESLVGGEVNERSDLYSLAVIFYQILCGRCPFEHEQLHDLMQAHLEEVPLSPRCHEGGIPPGLARLILEGLSKDPEQRWESAEWLEDALQIQEVRVTQKFKAPQLPTGTYNQSEVQRLATGPGTRSLNTFRPRTKEAPSTGGFSAGRRGLSRIIRFFVFLVTFLIWRFVDYRTISPDC